LFKRLIAPLCAAALLGSYSLAPALAAPRSEASVSILGAGSTFDQPFFDKAFAAYQTNHDVAINYQPVGSGAGIAQFTAKTVDFGATDVPLNPVTELPAAQKAGGALVEIPVALGGVSIAYNLPGIKTGIIHLTGPVLAQIFLGTIKTWNAKPIKALNPKVKLPSMAIQVVHRSDGSGTSYIFTDYLSKVSDQWRGLVGTTKVPNWPTGLGEKGNPGVATTVLQTPGAIGYVELAYVLQNKMKQAMMLNSRKQYEVPTLKSVAAAAASFKHVSATNFSIVDAAGKDAYPVAGYSWVLLFQNNSDTAKGKALNALFKWLVTNGQKIAKTVQYVPLPSNVQSLGLGLVKKVH
jgi:phosphate transport system substrate-binding protein